MRTWMLLLAVAFGLLVAPLVSAESPPAAGDAAMAAEDDLGLDLDADPVAEMGVAPAASAAPAAAAPTSTQARTAELEAQARKVATQDAAAPAAATTPAQAPVASAVEAAAMQPVVEAPVDTNLADGAVLMGDEGDAELEMDESPMAESEAAAPAPRAAAGSSISMGPMAVDDEGRIGRIHTVASGDTLWDISNAYLGTPWVWPAVWNDNEGISNPHRIAPGDRIWITAGEMRIVTDEEAHEMISAVPDEEIADEDLDVAFEEAPASVGDEDELLEAATPTSMEELPVAMPAETARTARTGSMVRVSEAESLGYVSPDVIEAASSIVGSPEERTWLAEGDRIYLGLGEGQTRVGDEFTIYRDTAEVRDLDGTLLGYHVAVLGWAVVRDTDPESSVAEVRQSQHELRRGDRVIPRDPVVINVPVKISPDALPGHIIYMPDSRTAMGDGEWVYLNRGSLHGVEPGTEMEVYVPGEFVKDPVSREKVLTPDDVVGEMIIVDTQPDSSVAYIVHAERVLRVGDKVRPVVPQVARR